MHTFILQNVRDNSIKVKFIYSFRYEAKARVKDLSLGVQSQGLGRLSGYRARVRTSLWVQSQGLGRLSGYRARV